MFQIIISEIIIIVEGLRQNIKVPNYFYQQIIQYIEFSGDQASNFEVNNVRLGTCDHPIIRLPSISLQKQPQDNQDHMFLIFHILDQFWTETLLCCSIEFQRWSPPKTAQLDQQALHNHDIECSNPSPFTVSPFKTIYSYSCQKNDQMAELTKQRCKHQFSSIGISSLCERRLFQNSIPLEFYQWHRNFRAFIILKMKEEKLNNRPQKYSKIALKRRQKLTDLVVKQGMSISGASKRLGIKNSTAKLIIKKYKRGEQFFESKKMREERIKKQEQENGREEVENGPENQVSTSNAVSQMQTVPTTFPFDYYILQCQYNNYFMPFSYAFVPLI